jgi:hypothetical protein
MRSAVLKRDFTSDECVWRNTKKGANGDWLKTDAKLETKIRKPLKPSKTRRVGHSSSSTTS